MRSTRCDAIANAGMVDADIRIDCRVFCTGLVPQNSPGSVRIGVDQEANEVLDVGVGAGQPILHRQEIRADVLRRARYEAQDLRDPTQHSHLCRGRRPVVV